MLLVDSGEKPKTRALLGEVAKLANKPIRYLINTSIDADHTGGNETIANLNGPITNLPIQNTPGASLTQSAQILAHDNVMLRMSGRNSPTATPAAAWPTESFINDEKELYFNGEAVRIYHPAPGHTDGDSIVYFRKSDVIATGDLFTPDAYPVIDGKLGGGLQGVIDGLNMILEIAVPAHHEEGGTMISPRPRTACAMKPMSSSIATWW